MPVSSLAVGPNYDRPQLCLCKRRKKPPVILSFCIFPKINNRPSEEPTPKYVELENLHFGRCFLQNSTNPHFKVGF